MGITLAKNMADLKAVHNLDECKEAGRHNRRGRTSKGQDNPQINLLGVEHCSLRGVISFATWYWRSRSSLLWVPTAQYHMDADNVNNHNKITRGAKSNAIDAQSNHTDTCH